MNCDHCGKPITDPKNAVAYDEHRFHKGCAIRSESGERPPIGAVGGYGLWAFTPSRKGRP